MEEPRARQIILKLQGELGLIKHREYNLNLASERDVWDRGTNGWGVESGWSKHQAQGAETLPSLSTSSSMVF